MAGWNADAQPWECPTNQAPQLDNFLIRPGNLVMRGPIIATADLSGLASGAPLNVCGAIVSNAGVLVARKSNLVDPWNSPLFLGGGSPGTGLTGGVWIPNLNGTPAPFTFGSQDVIPGPHVIDFYGTLYGISYGASGAPVPSPGGGYTMAPLSLYTATASGSAAPTLTALSAAPHGAFDLIAYQSRVWLLGGVDTPGAGTVHEPTTLYFTNPIVAGGGAASGDWKDPVSNTTNKIHMDGDASDFGVGLGVVRNGLVIFRRSSIYLLRGSTTSNYTLVPISNEVGCVDARSIVESSEGVYFMSRDGLMLTNGTTVANVSGSILHTLQAAVRAEQFAVTQTGGYVSCARVAHGQILVSVGTYRAGQLVPMFAAMYDPATRAWVRITSSLWANDARQQVGNNYCGPFFGWQQSHTTLTIGDKYVSVFESDTIGVSFLEPQTGIYDVLPSGVTPCLAIPANWTTPMPAVTTAAKRTFGHAMRYYLDYQFSTTGVARGGWTIQPIDGNRAALDVANQVPADTLASLAGFVSGVDIIGGSVITRQNYDFVKEIGDIQFVTTWVDVPQATSASAVAEIYGLGIEFQHSRERR